ncbi:ABC transporter ATP-binding protein [Erysipelothrix sp. HDW6C]|uniref:ABC transporter ATP-binding protein n=1 Tax=Erysipelothrix sp. HDW6C TaxID=2714930 RepID=UPI00140E0336|nr:ABC transporter ATP-binding protein [Erysipelothrix sp. HDW6C]QIK70311.1 ABC transporter ATP-binding protein [Erysipelothrix sp. HDW6C]
MSLIKANNINYFYQDGDQRRFILRDVNVAFEKGTFHAILGQSGSGKTTFLSLLSALDEPKDGTIVYEDKDVKAIGYDKYRRDNIGIIFQSYNLVPHLTAHENVLLAMSITDNELPKDQNEVAYNLLDYIGITKSKADRLVTKLSGGEQQRVAIARALATNVDLILADEPTGNLDEEMEQEIINIFKTLAHEHNKCVIVVTHSNEIARQADVSYYLRKGNLSKLDEETNV